MGEDRQREGDDEPGQQRHEGQEHVLAERPEVLVEVVDDPARAEPVLRDAAAARALSEEALRSVLGEDDDRGEAHSATSSLAVGTSSAGRFSAWAMTSIDSTPAILPCASATAAYRLSTLSRSPSASRRMSSTSRTGCAGAPASDALVPLQVALAQPADRPVVVVDQQRELREVGVLHGRPQLADVVARLRRRDLPQVDVAHPLQREALERAVGAHELLDELVGRVGEHLRRRGVLGEVAALAQDGDLVAHLDRLVDVVRDEDDGLGELGLQAEELVLEALAVDRVDGAERLVHEQDGRVDGERAGDADALALAAGELRRVAVADLVGVERDELDELVHARADARSLSQPSSFGTVAMLSPTVRCGNRPICWIA